MEQKVPGGRKISLAEEEFVYDSEPEDGLPYERACGNDRPASNSLPRIGVRGAPVFGRQTLYCHKSNIAPLNLLYQSYTMDEKKKSRRLILRSFGYLVNKIIKQVSATTTKIVRRQSGGSDRDEDRAITGSNHLPDLGLHLERMMPSGHLTPGVVGLQNHGNTCFMNAVLQCLNNTEQLVRYLISDQYKNDIKQNNKQNAKKHGMRGALTEQLALLLKSLWTCRYTADVSSEFKAIVGKYGNQYRGYAQHDAQEFLLWLLDKVHEDLNVASKKKYKPNKSSRGRPDEVLAAEALANHARCNSSFIYDLFQALYRSSLTCSNCGHHSNTFDPFLSVSLPIPHTTRHPVYVTVVYLSATPKQVRIGLQMNPGGTIRDLRQTLANDTKIPEEQMVLAEIGSDGCLRTLFDNQPIKNFHDASNIYAIETPSAEMSADSSSSVMIVAINVLVEFDELHSTRSRFGEPLVLQLPRLSTFVSIQMELLRSMHSRIRDKFKDTVFTKKLLKLQIVNVENRSNRSYLSSDDEYPLCTDTIDWALSRCTSGGPTHVLMAVEWDKMTKDALISDSTDTCEEHESVHLVKLAHQQPTLSTLDECFQVYTQKEQLGADDAWFCPNCRKRQQGTLKSLGLWSLPKVLVIHLKRFKQDAAQRTKLNTLVTFPITGLDMSQHIPKGALNANQATMKSNLKADGTWINWKPGRKQADVSDRYNYDLYAVCNHYGNMQGGHYTAFCKNPIDGRWYSFNDSQAIEIQENEVVTKAAYLLFYQKRSTTTSCRTAEPRGCAQNMSDIEGYIPRTTTSHSLNDFIEFGFLFYTDATNAQTESDVGKCHLLNVETAISAPKHFGSPCLSVQEDKKKTTILRSMSDTISSTNYNDVGKHHLRTPESRHCRKQTSDTFLNEELDNSKQTPHNSRFCSPVSSETSLYEKDLQDPELFQMISLQESRV